MTVTFRLPEYDDADFSSAWDDAEEAEPTLTLETKAANKTRTGAMVALWLPSPIADRIAVPGGEDAETMHVTLAYLGDAAELDADAALEAVQAAVLRQDGPLECSFTGAARFGVGDDGVPEVLLVNAVGLGALRARLVEELELRDVEVSKRFDFLAHTTVRYLDEADGDLAAPPLVPPKVTWQTDELVLAVGAELTYVPFDGLDEKGLRRVRTPAGVRRFGQPIGTVIVPGVDLIPGFDPLDPGGGDLLGPAGESAEAKKLVPSIEQLIVDGLDPEAAVKEHKRLHHNRTVQLIRQRQKADKAAAAVIAVDQKLDAPPKLDHDLDPEILADLYLDKQTGENPQALYDAQGLGTGVTMGPGAVYSTSSGSAWARAVRQDTETPIPVRNLTLGDHRVKRGLAIRRSGVTYLVEHRNGESDTDALLRARTAADVYRNFLKDVPGDKGLKSLQVGVALLANPNPHDAHWAKQYGVPGFRSSATGGRGAVYWWDTAVEPALAAHEFGHIVDTDAAAAGGLSRVSANPTPIAGGTKTWGQAGVLDATTSRAVLLLGQGGGPAVQWTRPSSHTPNPGGEGITSYGANSPSEDFAESVRLYMKDHREARLGYLKNVTQAGVTPAPAGTSAVGGVRMNIRFADLWPERARLLDQIFGVTSDFDSPYKKFQRKRADDTALAEVKAGASYDDRVVSLQRQHGLTRIEAVQATARAEKIHADALQAAQAKSEAEAAINFAEALKAHIVEKLPYVGVWQGEEDADLGDEEIDWDAKGDLLKDNGGDGTTPEFIELLTDSGAPEDAAYADFDALVDLVVAEKKSQVAAAIAKAQKFADEEALQQATAQAAEFEASTADYVKLPKETAKKIRKKKAAVKFYAKKAGASPEEAQLAADEYELNAIADALGDLGLSGTPTLLDTTIVTGAKGHANDKMVPKIKSGANKAAREYLDQAGAVAHAKSVTYTPGKNMHQGYYGSGSAKLSNSSQRGPAKDYLILELADRLNNEQDWEIFRAYMALDQLGGPQTPANLKAFGHYTEDARLRLLYADVNSRISQWASTAGDSSLNALLMQHAIKDEFGLSADWGARFLSGNKPSPGSSNEKLLERVQDQYKTVGPYYRRVARVMYEHTQESLAANGIKEVGVHRGMSGMGWTKGTEVRPALQPANSWASSKAVAKRFGHQILSATVPASRILGSARTGFGCLNEAEFVILDSDGLAAVSSKNYY